MSAAYSLDADPQGIRARVADAITGALAFGAQGTNPPPDGHWLAPFWRAAQADAQWSNLFREVSRLVNCLPSSFPDANDHVLRKIKALAEGAPRQGASMPQYWSVTVTVDGQDIVSIGHDWLSGNRPIEQQDEQAIVGAAQHLLSFVGYGLPPCDFNPDEDAAPKPGAGWRPIAEAPTGTREMFVAQAFNVSNGFTGDKPYTTDPWCVWRQEDGSFARWPHHFPPTHFLALPAAPTQEQKA